MDGIDPEKLSWLLGSIFLDHDKQKIEGQLNLEVIPVRLN